MKKTDRKASEKNAVRAQVKRALAAMTPDERAAKSAAIIARLLGRIQSANIKTLMAYASFGAEVETGALLSACLERKIQLLLPRMNAGSETMQAAVISDLARDLVPHPLGFLEPRADAPALDSKASIDLIIVPGIAFDYDGHRLGRGRGHYDRFLETPSAKRALKYGFAFEIQILDRIPVDPHDRNMDCIVTENRMIVAP